jgi:outer membrane protein TolC
MRVRGSGNSGGALRRRARLPAVALLLLLGSAVPSLAEDSPPVGATVGSLLDLAHRLSPTLRAAALDRAAAQARADRADALADPMLSVQTQQVPNASAPMDQTSVMLQQEFPLWGKLGLRKSAALALVDASIGEERAAALELDEKIKIAFAITYRLTQSLLVNSDIARINDDMKRAAASRFGQGVGTQAELLAVTAELTRNDVERIRLKRELALATAQINILLARSPAAPLAAPEGLPPLPDTAPTLDALLLRLHNANPVLFAADARVRNAEAQRDLAQKDWYPDVTLGAGAQTNFGRWGVAASVGIRIPLQWGAHDSEVREADASLGAARERLTAATAEAEGMLAQALASLTAAKETSALRRGQLVPQLAAAYKSALFLYASGTGDLTATLEAVHRLHDTQFDLLDSDVEGETSLAAIERLLGGPL